MGARAGQMGEEAPFNPGPLAGLEDESRWEGAGLRV